ncbi:MAG TPA: apolipoprotein N-acyltransferase [Pyrinomonadaceae bacterium]|nr:apolipoprotein N-acyltransferase [Pyrinomonadaceae bacterium]
MQETVSVEAAPGASRRLRVISLARAALPTRAQAACAVVSAHLLLFAFPDTGAWPLAWVALVPVLYQIARRPRAAQSFTSGLLAGTFFFYTSCYWLAYPMIHYADFPAPLAYALLLFPAAAGGLFPALFALGLARLCARWGASALVLAPVLWAASEWARLGVIGQLWNAVGYSQAFRPELIQAARFGGVYAVGFLVVAVNAALAYLLLKRNALAVLVTLASLACVALLLLAAGLSRAPGTQTQTGAFVVAVQPNVIPDFNRGEAEYDALRRRHFELSAAALGEIDESNAVRNDESGAVVNQPATVNAPPRVVVWPESPMNFTLARDRRFREEVGRFVTERRTSLLFNSLEPAAGGGGYNAAVLVNEKGVLAAQYDKIRLMPFGEYVPLPRWVPGASLVRGVVGDFTPGERYNLIPLGETGPRAATFICLESAYPYITRRLTLEGADVLVEMTNDAYQGDTSILRQHLSNAVFRAVENGRVLLRVTNTGVSARVSPRGVVTDETPRFKEAVRTWTVARSDGGETFYTRFGDAFVAACALLSAAALALTFRGRRVLSQS